MNKNKIDFSYWEPTNDLQVRIDAHKKYSIFSLEEYIDDRYKFDNCNVLDIGCGNGNFSSNLSLNANLYIGTDKNKKSLQEARSKYKHSDNVFFIEQSMDCDLLLPNDAFDYIFFIYSIYYSNDSEQLIDRCFDALKTNGKLIIIGPSINNAWEVDDFCYKLFNREGVSSERVNRINDEFIPMLNKLNFTVTAERVSFDVKFPSIEEYLKYIMATLQYRNSYSGDLDIEEAKKLLADEYNLLLHKQSVVVCATK